jgi:hypothetical protein
MTVGVAHHPFRVGAQRLAPTTSLHPQRAAPSSQPNPPHAPSGLKSLLNPRKPPAPFRVGAPRLEPTTYLHPQQAAPSSQAGRPHQPSGSRSTPPQSTEASPRPRRGAAACANHLSPFPTSCALFTSHPRPCRTQLRSPVNLTRVYLPFSQRPFRPIHAIIVTAHPSIFHLWLSSCQFAIEKFVYFSRFVYIMISIANNSN